MMPILCSNIINSQCGVKLSLISLTLTQSLQPLKQLSYKYKVVVYNLIRRPFSRFSEITMYGTLVCAVCILVMVESMYGDTGSGVPTACPVKCDLIQEIQILRQLLNQESILRINTNDRLQELEKIVNQNTQRNNGSLDEIKIAMAKLEQATRVQLTEVKRSIQSAETSITATHNTNRGTRQTLTKLEQGMVSLNQTYQGKYKAHKYTSGKKKQFISN